MKSLTQAELFELFDASVHDALWRSVLRFPDAEAVVVFENVDFCSSAFGQRTAVVVGPSNTFRSVQDCEGKWLNELPSQRQYPQAFCPTSELKKS